MIVAQKPLDTTSGHYQKSPPKTTILLPRGSLGVTSETPKSVGECEGGSLHTPKATPKLGEGVPMDSRNFRERFEGSNLNG
jgi:hypothetical protein